MQFYPFITNRLNVIERTGAARMAKLQSLGGETTENFLTQLQCARFQLANLLRNITIFYRKFTNLLNRDSRSSRAFQSLKVAVCAQ